MHELSLAEVTSLYLFRYNLVQWKCHMLAAARMRIVLLVTSLNGQEPPHKSYDATCTREGHTTIRKHCQPTSTLLTRMC